MIDDFCRQIDEKMLIEELEGYEDYMKKTKYRVIPGFF